MPPLFLRGLVSLTLLLTATVVAQPPTGPERWEAQIAAFEQQDRAQWPTPGGIVFTGSSSIRGWDMRQSFPDLPVLNRGFGGSQMADAAHFAERIVVPAQPRTVVVYSGDNDIAQGKTPEQVAAAFADFVHRIHATLPATRIVILSIKPSIARWKLVETMRAANGQLQAIAARDKRLLFVDVGTVLLGSDGQPRAELFKKDGLHLNDAGYALWTAILRPHLLPVPEIGSPASHLAHATVSESSCCPARPQHGHRFRVRRR